MTDPVPSKGECRVCGMPDDDHLDWCTPQAREQRPSKDIVAELRATNNRPDFAQIYLRHLAQRAADVIEEFRRSDRRWENAHRILLAESERLKRPAHEREPPHCQSCSCGMTPEPPAEQVIQCPNCAMPMRVPASSQPPGAGQQ